MSILSGTPHEMGLRSRRSEVVEKEGGDHADLLLVTNPPNTYKCIAAPCARGLSKSASFPEFHMIELRKGNQSKICRYFARDPAQRMSKRMADWSLRSPSPK
jgi:hypothetical protein